MSSEPIFQPAGSGRFARELLDLLTDEDVTGFLAVVAFATLDGVLLLGPKSGGVLHEFLSRGGTVDLIIGSDRVTTEDALRTLRQLSDSFPESFKLRVYSSQSRSLFHPKFYMLQRIDGSATILTGSNNLTRGGLFANTEYAVREEVAAADYLSRRDVFDEIAATPNAVGNVTDGLLQELGHQRQAERIAAAALAAGIASRVVDDGDFEPRVLLQTVPKAGGRYSQVGIKAQTMAAFFGLEPGQQRIVRLQQVQPGQVPGQVESRPLVRSPINKNSRIEVGGLQHISYPSSGARPILVFEEIESDLFRYLVLVPGDDGYGEISTHLATLPRNGSSLPSEITSVGQLLAVWPSYPV